MVATETIEEQLDAEVMTIIINSAMDVVRDEIDHGQFSGPTVVSARTCGRLKITPSKKISDLIARYLPSRVRGFDVLWRPLTGDGDDFMLWRWSVWPPPPD